MFGVSDVCEVKLLATPAVCRTQSPGLEPFVAPMAAQGTPPRFSRPLPVEIVVSLEDTDQMWRMPPESSVFGPRWKVTLPKSDVSCSEDGMSMVSGIE